MKNKISIPRQLLVKEWIKLNKNSKLLSKFDKIELKTLEGTEILHRAGSQPVG